MINNTKHTCCNNMHFELEVDKSMLTYDIAIRSYFIIAYKSSYGDYQLIKYCPWCGSKLPKELSEERCEILEKEFGIKDPGWKKDDELPEEFRTDEWWKKRGL